MPHQKRRQEHGIVEREEQKRDGDAHEMDERVEEREDGSKGRVFGPRAQGTTDCRDSHDVEEEKKNVVKKTS